MMQVKSYTKNIDAVKWQQAIDDAKVKISEHTRKIRSLRRAIHLIKQQIAAGEPWPKQRNNPTKAQ